MNNDQIPSFANAIASSITTSLAVNQYSDHPLEVLDQFQFLTSFAASIITTYNPILGHNVMNYVKVTPSQKFLFFNRMMYKDPSIGGVCSTNLPRFFISRFPDPVCESLAWWKIIYRKSKNLLLRQLAVEAGNLKIGSINNQTMTMLLESPTSLNIPVKCDHDKK